MHNWATSGHWVAHHESTLLESVPKQLGFVTTFEDVMTWWPGPQHQRLCKGGFSNLHGDSKSQHLSWLLTVPSCSPEAAVSPATLVWYPWQLREMGSGEVVHIMPNWDSDSDGSASLVVHKWNRITIPEAERRRFPAGGRRTPWFLTSSHKYLTYHLQLGIHLPLGELTSRQYVVKHPMTCQPVILQACWWKKSG